MIRFFLLTVLVCAAHFSVIAVYADDFPPLYNSEGDSEKPLPAQEAASGMEVPEGFRVTVFASEPDVQNPIAMTFDARGRVWVAENYTYAERSMRFDLNLRDRVLILEDTDGDGVSDKRTVFTDQVQMLTSVEVGHGGAWLMCPPQLLFIPDRDGDDQADGPAQVILDGFEVAKENYHNFANGLRWGPDGWLYGRCGGSCPGRIGAPGAPLDQRVALEGGIWRYSPRTKQFEVLTHGTTNPWGHDWNERGEGFFINTVNGHLWHLIPGAHLVRPFTLDPNPHAYELIDMHADHWHFDTGSSWQKSRDGAANPYGGGHAHCGMMIYLGDNWPDAYRGRLFTWNFHGRRANQEILERHGSGFVGRHGQDILLSKDPFFRGMELSYGPDGSVFAIDWSDLGECHEHTGVHRVSGRVFRISHQSGPATSKPITDLRRLSNRALVELMKHRNEWFARQARLVLAERSQPPSHEPTKLSGEDLKDLPQAKQQLQSLVEGDQITAAYRALVALHAMGAADPPLLRSLLTHPDETLRVWGVRLLTDHWPIDDIFGPIPRRPDQQERWEKESQTLLDVFCDLAKRDSSSQVRLALASALQRLPVQHRAKLAMALMSRHEDALDHNLPLLVWYGLMPVADAEPKVLVDLVIATKWPKTQGLMVRRLTEEIERIPEGIASILGYVASCADPAIQENIMQSFAAALKGWQKAPQPENWGAVVQAIQTTPSEKLQGLVRELSVLFGDGRAMEEVRRIVLDEQAEISLRRSALETLVNTNREDLRSICFPLLQDARLNVVAARGLAKYDDPQVAQELVKAYRRFRGAERPKVIAILVSRPTFATCLLQAIAEEKIPISDLTAYDVRQIQSLNDSGLTAHVKEAWGEVRDSPADRQQRIHDLKQSFNSVPLSAADLSNGRQLFVQSCAKCHRLFGVGETIGPDLTGANRNNLDYLLENVIDPSAVVNKDFRMTVVVLEDGRVLNGLVLSKNDKTFTLQTQTDQQTIAWDRVESSKVTNLSPMPDGLIDNLSGKQIRDLFAYLMHPSQVPLPKGATVSE